MCKHLFSEGPKVNRNLFQNPFRGRRSPFSSISITWFHPRSRKMLRYRSRTAPIINKIWTNEPSLFISVSSFCKSEQTGPECSFWRQQPAAKMPCQSSYWRRIHPPIRMNTTAVNTLSFYSPSPRKIYLQLLSLYGPLNTDTTACGFQPQIAMNNKRGRMSFQPNSLFS